MSGTKPIIIVNTGIDLEKKGDMIILWQDASCSLFAAEAVTTPGPERNHVAY